MAFFTSDPRTEPARTGRRSSGPQRVTSLWDKDGGKSARAPPPARSAELKTSLWGSEAAAPKQIRSSKKGSYSRTSLWGSEEEQPRRQKPQQPRRPAPWEPQATPAEAGRALSGAGRAPQQGGGMFSGSKPAETTYQGNSGEGSLVGELAIDLQAKFRTAAEAFLAADADRSGALSIDELISVCRANQLPPDNVQAAMSSIDVDRNGRIDYNEFARRLFQTVEQPTASQNPAQAPVSEPTPDEIKKRLIQEMVASGASEDQIFQELARFDASRGVAPPQAQPQAQAPQQPRAAPPTSRPGTGHKYNNASDGVSSIFGGYEADAELRRARPLQPVDNSPPADAFRPRVRKAKNRNTRSTALW